MKSSNKCVKNLLDSKESGVVGEKVVMSDKYLDMVDLTTAERMLLSVYRNVSIKNQRKIEDYIIDIILP